MKKLIALTLLFGIAQAVFSQQAGTILYKETVKMDIDLGDAAGGMDLSQFLPESMTFHKALHYNELASVYTEGKEEGPEDKEMTSDDGSISMVMKFGNDTEDIFFMDYQEKKVVHQQGFMGREFRVLKTYPKYRWKLTNEKVKYLDYECTKATTVHKGQEVIAWFTPQLPAQVGPNGFGQLPGAILMLSIDGDKTEIMATDVTLGEPSIAIERPKKGKEVTKEEYDKIIDEKKKEMQKQMGGNGSSIIIRG